MKTEYRRGQQAASVNDDNEDRDDSSSGDEVDEVEKFSLINRGRIDGAAGVGRRTQRGNANNGGSYVSTFS